MSEPVDSCACWKGMHDALEPMGIWVDRPLIGPVRTFVSVSWRPMYQRKRGEKLPNLLATYCPFCGVKYPDLPEKP